MGKASFWSQFNALIWKNFLLKKRNKKQTIQEFLMPLYFILILALIRRVSKPNPLPQIPSFPTYDITNTSLLNPDLGSYILVVPDTNYTQTVMAEVAKILISDFNIPDIKLRFFNSNENATASYLINATNIIGGVTFDLSSASNNLSYAIRVPYHNIAKSIENVYSDQSQCRQGNGLDVDNCDANTYLHTGFAIIQSAIDLALMKESLQKPTRLSLKVDITMLPKPGFVPDTTYMQVMSSLYFVVAYSPFINFLMVNLVAEKEKKIKEGMKMMGLRDAAFWLSWGFVYSVIIIIVSAAVAVIAYTTSFFSHSNLFLFFLLLVLYGLSFIGASFAATPFFNKAQVAGAVASLASLLISTLYLVVSLTRTYTATGVQYTIPVWGRSLLCLLSPVCLALAIDQTVYLDIVNPEGLSFSTLTSGDFPVIIPLVMLFVDSVLYFLLAIYLDNVIPGEYGSRYPPWYIFMPSYWCHALGGQSSNQFGNPVNTEASNTGSSENIEIVPREMRQNVGVRIVNLTKEYSPKKADSVLAVNGLCLDIYENQITALLGHNGAGKTTTLNILTGLTSPTSGTAFIKGLNVSNKNELSEIRSQSGVCPQHNILFDHLTCIEHLELFAGIKGIQDDQRQQQIAEALDSVGLKEQKDVSAAKLSGGQKRKLSVAIAIIGDPKIIFLDEPTAGMDPYSRRHLWSVLKEKKKGRIILLTTHFMDEADILADRKAIINKGALRCCGSSLFLKNRFGIGYHLNMVVKPTALIEKIFRYVSRYVQGVEVNRHHGQELDLMLPLNQVSHFSDLFSGLEHVTGEEGDKLDEDIGILSYGIAMTTLEEVFLELEKEHDNVSLEDLGKGKRLAKIVEMENLAEKRIAEIPEMNGRATEDGNVTIENLDDAHAAEVDNIERPPEVEGLLPTETCVAVEEANFKSQAEHPDVGVLLKGSALAVQRFMALFKVKFLRNSRNKQLLFYQLVLPIILVVIGVMVSNKSHVIPDGKNPAILNISAGMYARLKTGSPVIGRFGPVPPILGEDSIDSTASRLILQGLSSAFLLDPFNANINLLNTSFAPHYLGLNLTSLATVGNQLTEFSYTAFYNDSAVHAIPAIINLMSNVIFKTEEALTGKGGNSSSISVSSWPWPTHFQKTKYTGGAFASVILLAMAFSVIPSGFGVDIVKDRESKVRSQLRISGVPFWLYWATSIAVDALKYSMPAVLIVTMTFVLKVEVFDSAGSLLSLVLLCVTYIPSNVLFSYVFSYMFNSWESAQAVQPTLFIFGGFMPYVAVSLIDTMSSESTASMVHLISCCAMPPYSIFGGIYYIDKVYRVATMKMEVNKIAFGEYFTANILVAILLPILQVLVNFVLLRVLDVRDTGGSVADAFGCLAARKPHSEYANIDDVTSDVNEDDDVIEERQKVNDIKHQAEDRLFELEHMPVCMIRGLNKRFNNQTSMITSLFKKKEEGEGHVAVRNSSFTVNKGQVFGLLGPNGAGKTTTLNMITADMTPTKGEVYIGGHSIHSNMSEAFQAMGFCPQHDALWDLITLEEHLDCYARIRGIPAKQLKPLMDFFIGNLKLEEHVKKITKKLSGGTKRKLSYCMSMLGDPRVVLLDEPSTGLDPQSKRFLWDFITASFKDQDRGAILTTHYMEEADALCSRIAIMVNGKIQCIGSSQHLKHKYGSGYLLEIKLQLAAEEQADYSGAMVQLKDYIHLHFPDVVCVEEFSERVMFKVPRHNVKSLASAFKVLEQAKKVHSVEEFSFSQASLEQVFLDFAKKQRDEGEKP
ncbi:ABC-type organic anion transporter ABCA8B-like isoform X3 [Dreissena polymorpha]|uniref:ABC-type organic anion transporter ABCA8B-like isoform X3 n=1 Tax=Dreissena polymorpha TaxID=45954 RepID=UPI002264B87C|nr:ABC-type organic anion transporter ABCA8B-like isoform X3 [Dreissena polymorpha]